MYKRSFIYLSIGIFVLLGAPLLNLAANAGVEDEVRPVFEHFVAAQNAHDLEAVGAMLSDSEDFLWITRGTPIWGHEAALERFQALYKGTWSLEPAMDAFKVVSLSSDSAQIFVPVTFTIAPAGEPAQPAEFLMNQTLVKTGDGWKIASILPILIPPK